MTPLTPCAGTLPEQACTTTIAKRCCRARRAWNTFHSIMSNRRESSSTTPPDAERFDLGFFSSTLGDWLTWATFKTRKPLPWTRPWGKLSSLRCSAVGVPPQVQSAGRRRFMLSALRFSPRKRYTLNASGLEISGETGEVLYRMASRLLFGIVMSRGPSSNCDRSLASLRIFPEKNQ